MIVHIWTDGGCRPNPGVAAYGIILQAEGMLDKELSGPCLDEAGEIIRDSTSNRAELLAVINALKALKNTPHQVVLHTDSSYVKTAVYGVKRPTANQDLLREVQNLRRKLTTGITVTPVEGHSGQKENERCHQLVQIALRSIHV